MPKSKFLQGLVYNWPGKILSLAAAILIFLVIQMVTVTERSFSVPLDLLIPSSFIVENTVTQEVRLTIVGQEENLYRILPEQVRAYADFRDAASGGTYERNIILDTSSISAISRQMTFKPEPVSVKLYLSQTAPAGQDADQ